MRQGTQNIFLGGIRVSSLLSKTIIQRWFCRIFTVRNCRCALSSGSTFTSNFGGKPRLTRLSGKLHDMGCTIFGHRLVDGVHSIEKTCTYKLVFFIDQIF